MHSDDAPPIEIENDVRRALEEDVGDGDLTAALVPATARVEARVVARSAGVVCGTAWFDAVFATLDASVTVGWAVSDGDRVEADTELCVLRGPARPVLTGERAALNLLQTLSGTATQARRYADAAAGTDCRVLDTRKTLPGLRLAQKYAVRCGGCHNHRTGLFDGILIKENHILAAGGIGPAVAAARRSAPAGGPVPVEVEVEDMDELVQALSAGADVVMLDNFDLAALERAVATVRESGASTRLEASGNLTLEDIPAVAATGVDYISVGALTKHLRAMDLSMRVEISGT